jgi:hypothetical protein
MIARAASSSFSLPPASPINVAIFPTINGALAWAENTKIRREVIAHTIERLIAMLDDEDGDPDMEDDDDDTEHDGREDLRLGGPP